MQQSKEKKFISYRESREILDTISYKLPKSLRIPLMESLGKIVATDIVATNDNPEFPTAAMDGYALSLDDATTLSFPIAGSNPAGNELSSILKQGSCIKTFTGSMMPIGSDTLVPIENVAITNNTITIQKPVPKGFAVRLVGESYKKGDVLIKQGTQIGYAEIGVMAGLNLQCVDVFKTPIIAIASTGSEILDLGEPQTHHNQIRSTNHLTLEALAKKYGATVQQMGVVKDDKESIYNLLVSSIKTADIVVTTGGVSVGDYDFVKDIIKDKLGATLLFQGVNIKPGQHIIIAKKDDTFIVGLPGFAYSSTVTFILYVLPLLFKLEGSTRELPIIKAKTKIPLAPKGDKTTFEACNLGLENGIYTIDFDGKISGTSAILINMLGSVGLLIHEEIKNPLNVGDLVDVIMI